MKSGFLALTLFFLSLPIFGQSPKVFFSPAGGCTAEVVKEINAAKKSVWIQAYGFTSPPICDACVAAFKRHVDVRIVLDKKASQASGRKCKAQLLSAGVPVWVDGVHQIAHNKIIIVDHVIVLEGSFNFTLNAEKHNAENLVVLHALVSEYEANWNLHCKHSIRAVP